MTRMIFINFPVTDLVKSRTFYEAIGFRNNPQFTDDTAACMVWSEAIHVMILTHEKWRTFTDRPIPPSNASEVSLAISMDDRAAIDGMVETAAANGGSADVCPRQDLDFMYSRSFADPDGHVWEPMWMDPTAMPGS
jgi:predicted lactoylglutathione lyase